LGGKNPSHIKVYCFSKGRTTSFRNHVTVEVCQVLPVKIKDSQGYAGLRESR
jgi:adenylate cyclase